MLILILVLYSNYLYMQVLSHNVRRKVTKIILNTSKSFHVFLQKTVHFCYFLLFKQLFEGFMREYCHNHLAVRSIIRFILLEEFTPPTGIAASRAIAKAIRW